MPPLPLAGLVRRAALFPRVDGVTVRRADLLCGVKLMYESGVMKDVDQALAVLGDIRARMAASSKFRGFAPEVVAFCGGLSLLAGLAQMLWPVSLAGDAVTYVKFWGAVMIAFGAVASVESTLRARMFHKGMADAMIASVGRHMAPFVITRVTIAAIILLFAPESAWLIPGLWLLLSALVCTVFTDKLARAIYGVAFWYFGCGVVVLVLASRDHQLSPWMMTIPLVVGHMAIASILKRKVERGETHDGQ